MFKHPELDLKGFPSNSLKERCITSTSETTQVPQAISNATSLSGQSVKEFSSEIFQGEVNPQRARSYSHHHYFTKVVNTKTIKVTHLSSEDSIKKPPSEGTSASSRSSRASFLSGSVAASEERMSSVSLRVEIVSCHSIAIVEPWYHQQAEVRPVQMPSVNNPVAPDGKQAHRP